MPSPLFLAAASFFTVIVVGSLLVAINDWLERRHADPQPAIGIGPRRAGLPLYQRRHGRSVRPVLRLGGQGRQRPVRDLVVDMF